MGNELILDSSYNLVNAYAKERDALKSGVLKPADIVRLRAEAMELLVVQGGKGQGPDLVEPATQFKGEQEGANVDGFVHPEVIERLRSYGYEVTQHEGGGTSIRYRRNVDTAEVAGSHNLESFAVKLNQMVHAGRSPERIAAFAVQELLLIHPFRGGNGRTARLLGQIIYFNMTGKSVIFPKEFHMEMAYSLDQLEALLSGRGVREGAN